MKLMTEFRPVHFRLFSLAMVLIILLSIIPARTFALSAEESDDFLDNSTDLISPELTSLDNNLPDDQAPSDGEMQQNEDDEHPGNEESNPDISQFSFSVISSAGKSFDGVNLVSKDSGTFVLEIPVNAILSRTYQTLEVVSSSSEQQFTVRYTKYDSEKNATETVVTSNNGKAKLDNFCWYNLKNYGISGSEKELLLTKEISIQFGDQQSLIVIQLKPYCDLVSLRMQGTSGTKPVWPITQIDQQTFVSTVSRGSQVQIAATGGVMGNTTPPTASKIYFDSEQTGLLNYTPGEEAEKTYAIKIADEAGLGIEDRVYTLIIKVLDADPFPVLKNYTKVTSIKPVQFDELILTVETENTDENTVYQWTLKGQPVGENSASYSVDTSKTGMNLIKCQITNVVDGIAYSTTTGNISVSVQALKVTAPVIKTQPASGEYTQGEVAKLTVEIDKLLGNKYTYQWYSNSSNSNTGGTPIEGATEESYVLPTNELGTFWYYCEVKATYQTVSSETVKTDCAEITIVDAGHKMEGEGTEEEPFLIKTASDLEAIREMVKAGNACAGIYYSFANDISLPDGWEPIGCTKDGSNDIQSGANLNAFSGIIDGKGYTLTVPAGGLPLLGYVKGATVKNLAIYGTQIAGYGLVNNLEGVGLSGEAILIDNVTLKSGTQTLKSGLIGANITTNGFAGCSAGFYATIRNCVAEENVIVGYDGSQRMIGSFAGRMQGTIENCVSYATVKGTDYVGGIIGTRDNAMGTCFVTGCEFNGSVEASGNFAGGIVGGGYHNGTAPNGVKISINDSKSSGKISGADSVGGIVGGDLYVAQAWNGYSLKNNSFTGSVSATNGVYVGGIIGFYDSLNRLDNISGNYYSSDCGANRGIGFVKYIDTNCETHEVESGALYINTENSVADCPAVSGCNWQTGYQRSDDPLGVDAAKLCYTDSAPVIATELVVSGDYQTTYIVGENLNLDYIILTVKYSDGSTNMISLDDVIVTGFDSSERGEKTVKLTYDSVYAEITVTVLKPTDEKITITFSILGDEVHAAETTEIHTLAGNNLTAWVNETKYTVDVNATVADVLKKVLEDNEMTCKNTSGNYVESITRNGQELGGLTNGANSGWLYLLNGRYPDLGVAEQYLEDGDVIIFHYTDDYTKENWGGYDKPTDPDPIDPENRDPLEVYNTTGDYMQGLGTPTVNSIGGEWMVLGLARSDRDVPEGYYDNVIAYVQENINENEQLHKNKSTDNARVILALTAAGYDVTDVDGHNLLAGFTDMNYVKKQGINGPIWALIALDSHDYEIPEGSSVTREALIAAILDAQLPDGGWALSGETADPDMTAMALQALAKYKDANAETIEKGINCLSGMQNDKGGYDSWGTANSESCAQVIVALTALGIDPATDERFVKDGNSVIDALCSFYVEGGGFMHTAGSELNGMATEQGYYALTAYYRFKAGKTSLYDMSDVEIKSNPEPNPEPKTYTITFNANGGTGTMEPVTGVSGKYTLPECGFTAPDGKEFKGWATSASGPVITGIENVAADTTLYAIWENKTVPTPEPSEPTEPSEPSEPTEPSKPTAQPDAELKKEVAVPKANEAANITAEIKNNELGAALSGELADAFKLTDAEKASGVWVWLELNALSAEEVDSADAKLIQAALGENTLGVYMDIRLYKQAPGGEKVAVSEAAKPVTVSIVVPENLRAKDRTFVIAYTHEGGTAKVVTPSYNAETGVLTFQASQFSTYALAYKDAKVTPANPANPNTGDNSHVVFYATTLCISALGVALILAAQKKKYVGKHVK